MDFDTPTAIVVAIIGIIMFPINIAMLIQFLVFLKRIWVYVWFGLWIALIFSVLHMIKYFLGFPYLKPAGHATEFSALFLNFAKIGGMTMLGMYYCWRLNLFSFPATMQLINFVKTPGNWYRYGMLANPARVENGYFSIIDNVANLFRMKKPSPPDYTKVLKVAIISSIAFIVYSIILFSIFSPTMNEDLQEFSKLFYTDFTPSLFLVIIVGLMAAIGEEILFRLGIQNFLAIYIKLSGKRYFWAILISATLWTLSHWGQVDPNWVKMVQIFPAGILLGYVFKRYGIEACILIHALFNTILLSLEIVCFKGGWIITNL